MESQGGFVLGLCRIEFVERLRHLASTALDRLAAPRLIHQDPAHGLGRDRYKWQRPSQETSRPTSRR